MFISSNIIHTIVSIMPTLSPTSLLLLERNFFVCGSFAIQWPTRNLKSNSMNVYLKLFLLSKDHEIYRFHRFLCTQCTTVNYRNTFVHQSSRMDSSCIIETVCPLIRDSSFGRVPLSMVVTLPGYTFGIIGFILLLSLGSPSLKFGFVL